MRTDFLVLDLGIVANEHCRLMQASLTGVARWVDGLEEYKMPELILMELDVVSSRMWS